MSRPLLRRTSTRALVACSSIALAVTGVSGFLAAPASAAVASHLVIQEVYGGGGNTGATYTNDYVELYNPTSAAISVDGWGVQYRSKADGSAGVTPLTGSIDPGGYYLVQEAKGSGGSKALPSPDATGSLAMSGTDGEVLLLDSTTASTATGNLAGAAGVVDAVGFGAAQSYEGSAPAPAPSNTEADGRVDLGNDTDDNGTDFENVTPTPISSAGSSSTPPASTLTVASIPDAYGTVGDPIADIDATAGGGSGSYTWAATGLPAGVTMDPASGIISGTPTASGDDKVTVTATDAADDTGTATFYLAVGEPHPIAEIQGTRSALSSKSPLEGKEVETTGVVTAAYPTGGFNGFYIETGGAGGTAADDKTPGESDAVFVYGADAAKQVTVGESVEVIGEVDTYDDETEIEYPSVTKLDEELPAVVPDSLTWSDDLSTDAEKEAHMGELMAPQGDFTVTDDYNTNFYGEIELAAGDRMLEQPTDVGTAGSPEAEAAVAYNDAHEVTLDDGSSTTFSPTGSSKDAALPWLTTTTPVSDGAKVSFHQSVILDYRNDLWKLQPTAPISGEGSKVATFSDMRSQNATPGDVGSDVRLATFNMENFFPTTGEDYVSSGEGTCSWYDDKDGDHIAVDECTGTDGSAGPRGAATDASFQRQLEKEVTSIDGLGASVVSLEEVENGAQFASAIPTTGLPSSYDGDPRDYAVSVIVDALNQDAGDPSGEADGTGTWAYVPSPAASDLPPLSEQDVIRTAFIYQPAAITTVGTSHVLTGDSGTDQPFSIAREPMAQGFKAAGAPDSDAFLVVANHMKSKSDDASGIYSDCLPGGEIDASGSNSADTDDTELTDPALDQGGYNCTRVHEVHDMWAWAQTQAQALDTDKIFLVGDFNAYDDEDPITYLKDQGLTDVGAAKDPTHSSYSYDGLEGSLDHVLATPTAYAMVTGASIWQINAQESVAFAYSRYDYSGTTPNLFDGTTPWATSDHDPEVVGLDLPAGDTGTGTGPGGGTPPTQSAATVSASPVSVAQGSPATVQVTVSGSGSAQPTGTVTLTNGSTQVGTGTLSAGSAIITVPASDLNVGTNTLAIAYGGDTAYSAATGSVVVIVTPTVTTPPPPPAKVSSKVGAKASGKVVAGKKATLRITVSAKGVTATGTVRVKANGRTVTARLSGGHATVRLVFPKPGTRTVRVSYGGSTKLKASTSTVRITVRPAPKRHAKATPAKKRSKKKQAEKKR